MTSHFGPGKTMSEQHRLEAAARGATPPITTIYRHFPPSPFATAFELIRHRIFVGGFPPNTVESELRSFFEKKGVVREVKIIRNPDGSPKGYGFVTFDTDEEAQKVQQQSGDALEFKGRRLNVGPAMRRLLDQTQAPEVPVISPQILLSPGAYQGFALLPDGSAVTQAQGPATYTFLVPSQPAPCSPYPVFSHQGPSRVLMPQSGPYATPETPNSCDGDVKFSPVATRSAFDDAYSRGLVDANGVSDGYSPLTPITPTHRSSIRWPMTQMGSPSLPPTPGYPVSGYYPTVDMTHYSQMYPKQAATKAPF